MEIKLKTDVSNGATAEEIFQAILVSRGYKTKVQQEEFLHPKEPSIEYLLEESGLKKSKLKQAQKLLDSHLVKNNDICIFGDYDADGVSATAVMWQAVTAYAKQVGSTSRILPFLPDRHKHGYGLSDKAVGEVVDGSAFRSTSFKEFVPKLIITVDTGVVAHKGIKSFKHSSIDVIVTDHHLPADATHQALQAGVLESVLPGADCIVHTTSTSGAGIAWIFAMYLLGKRAEKLLDLATIGVVGDMMPLTGLNRAICVAGLSTLTKTKRPGLLSMKELMGVESKDITTYDISFGIAPRINAAGRIYNPLDALRLLCTSDVVSAKELASKIESHNKDRQEYTDRALLLAAKERNNHKIIVIKGDYHEGVIGLVAGKLTEMFRRPAVVMSDNGDVIKGSARSVPGVNITDILRSLKTPFLGLGGHDQAAGFSLSHDQVAPMIQELESLADKILSDNMFVKQESADLCLSLKSTSLALAKMIGSLEPFGIGNPKPKFELLDLNVLEDRDLGKDGKHHKLTVEQEGVTREVLMFNSKYSHPIRFIKKLICTIDINVWREKESLQLIGNYVEI